jgi:hypothetical protein
MINTIVGAGAVGAGAGATSRYGSGSGQKMRLLAAQAPAPQHWLNVLYNFLACNTRITTVLYIYYYYLTVF